LRQTRRERGLTRAELAFRAEISAQTLAKIEQGQSTDPGFTVVAAVAASLELNLDDLVERARQVAAGPLEPPSSSLPLKPLIAS
jgi:transcriptional regulator with XRE-family HTH domain